MGAITTKQELKQQSLIFINKISEAKNNQREEKKWLCHRHNIQRHNKTTKQQGTPTGTSNNKKQKAKKQNMDSNP